MKAEKYLEQKATTIYSGGMNEVKVINEEEQYDMHLQLQAMSMYNAVLINRIKRATAE